VAAVIAANPQLRRIEVAGHTDDRGGDALNLRLSQARAQAVVDHLVRKGIPKELLVAKGYGPSEPIDTNRTEAGRANNRRVEFRILEQEAVQVPAPELGPPPRAEEPAGGSGAP